MAAARTVKLDAPAAEKGIAADKQRVEVRAHKSCEAASISWLVVALRTWICSPMARAAASTSLAWLSALSQYWLD